VNGPPLACTVRDCGLHLERQAHAIVCARGHTYDIARTGYVNLLQPQDRRSLSAGDSREAIAARARLLAAGIGRALIDEIVRRVVGFNLPAHAAIADLGSGSGEALAAVADARPVSAIGIDLSTAAAEYAARRFSSLTWVVANADRRLPLLDASVALVLSLHGRRQPAECARVLASEGSLMVAVPAPDDLIELRAFVQGESRVRDRADALLTEHTPFFTLTERFSVRNQHALGRGLLMDLLQGTYRGARAGAAARVDMLETLDVTIASDVFVFLRKK
jgi:23S rRNA (guanine745-N1)-methyltransferase